MLADHGRATPIELGGCITRARRRCVCELLLVADTLHKQSLERDFATKVLQSRAALRELDEKRQSHIVRQTFLEAFSAATVGEVRRPQPEDLRSLLAAKVAMSGRELDAGSSGQVCDGLAVLADNAERLIRDMNSSTENREHS